ncbi:hypothetical protein GCM10010347_64250 [Streptomyces cirratus]|uniref:Uncharacterized protein n=1 Tax=Streptomyces cirratus TaxID=68187 RepID=A0ABQ3F2P4_9ACTN|nr:hypothetical protein GCM10010347_64250 [Streptomyces cirratus]
MLAAKFEAILPHFDERRRRLLIGAEAQPLGQGGIGAVARAAGVREATVSVGVRELDSGGAVGNAFRRPGAYVPTYASAYVSSGTIRTLSCDDS